MKSFVVLIPNPRRDKLGNNSERLIIYNFSLYPYIIIIIGIIYTILYSIRFLSRIFQFKRNKSLLYVSDFNFFIRIRILVLFFPAIRGGRVINYIIDHSGIFYIIPKGLKSLILIIIFYRIY